MIALSIVDRVVKGFSYVVKLWVAARVENDLIVKEIRRRGYKKVAVVSTINDAMLSLKQLVTDSVPERIVASEELNREDNDLRTVVLRILSKSPDAVYSLLWAPQPSLFARALREMGFKGPIFGVHNLEDPNEITNAAGALDEAWLVTGDDSAASDYIEEYVRRFASSPTAGGANAYDAAKLIIEGSRKELNEFLHTVQNFERIYICIRPPPK
jgi:branched-chain amino acid transport system substrate-binding protein